MKAAFHLLLAATLPLLLAACATPESAPPKALACDMQGLGQLKIDALTQIIAVKPFKAGEELRLANSPEPHVKAPLDLCMVKLVVGPGNPGPANAPSTSPGIGIEVWLPAAEQWNSIIRAYGSGGWAGGYYTDPTRIGQTGAMAPWFVGALQKGYAVSGSDHGHGGTVSGRNASFAMLPDGSVNTALWRDFSERSMLEQALKTKAVVRAYYGKAHAKAYFDGFSTGGRQGYKLAQKYPEQYDGILAGAPAFNWSRFIAAELYPQVVMQRELGGPMANAKLHAASGRAVAACGGATAAEWGFLLNPLACAYNPSRDAAALCTGAVGEVGTLGTGTQATCLSAKEAQALNKIWYGPTKDGSSADPGVDNAGTSSPSTARGQLWWGLTRGSDLTGISGDQAPFPISTQLTALTLGNPRIAQKGSFSNATGNGEDGWKALTYAEIAALFERGIAMQTQFADINTDAADLSKLRDRGAKVLSYHGLSDSLIMPQGSLNYWERVNAAMGGLQKTQAFNRLFLIPGHGHSGAFALSSSVGVDGKVISANQVPLPQPSTGRDELFNALRNWVEKGVAPERIDLSAASGKLSRPICAYPKQASLKAGGSPEVAASYVCTGS